MTSLITALQNTPDTLTENGALAHSTTGSTLLDAQFQLSAARKMDERQILNYFRAAMSEDAELAIRLLFYLRDVREGVGERNTFRVILAQLAKTNPTMIRKVIHFIPVYGRWDDLFILFGTPLEKDALEFIVDGLYDNSASALVAKWLPREHSSNQQKKAWAKLIRKHLGLTPKAYRKTVAALSSTVEQKMCAQLWKDINYQHVPSVAMARYRKAFERNDKERYEKYLTDLEAGRKKINASAVFPHDVLKPVQHNAYASETVVRSVNAQWAAMPNWLPDGLKILTVSDVSGSMTCRVSGSTSALDICVALTLYCSERLPYPYKNSFITFSSTPRFQKLIGHDVVSRMSTVREDGWAQNTDIQAVFNLVLRTAIDNNVPQNEMPDVILIMSDMQFDYCGRNTNLDTIRNKFSQAGYTIPKLVFWNLNAGGTFEAKANDKGVTLLGGFSPASMRFFKNLDKSPYETLLEILNGPRYSQIKI